MSGDAEGVAAYPMFEAMPLPMWVYDAATLRFLAVNSAALRQYGYTREEFLAMTLKDIRPDEEVDRLLATCAAATSARRTPACGSTAGRTAR